MDDVREKLRGYITKELMRNANYPLQDDERIITDSFALAELGVYIEQEFNIYIPDLDLTIAKMSTLNQICDRVQRDLNKQPIA